VHLTVLFYSCSDSCDDLTDDTLELWWRYLFSGDLGNFDNGAFCYCMCEAWLLPMKKMCNSLFYSWIRLKQWLEGWK
jgi:hypothetical protein